jgi:hypothetical protein
MRNKLARIIHEHSKSPSVLEDPVVKMFKEKIMAAETPKNVHLTDCETENEECVELMGQELNCAHN